MACWGEFGGKGRRCLVVARRMRLTRVVVFCPFGDSVARVFEAEEQGLVQQFIPHPPVEGLDEVVLQRKYFATERLG